MHTDEHEGINIEREKERNRLGLVRSHLFAHCGVMSFGRRSTYRFNEHFKGVQEQANWTTECVCVRAGERASKWMWACLQRRCQLYSTIDCNCIHSRWTGMVDFHIQQIFYRINITRTISPKWICNFVSVTLRCVSVYVSAWTKSLALKAFRLFCVVCACMRVWMAVSGAQHFKTTDFDMHIAWASQPTSVDTTIIRWLHEK